MLNPYSILQKYYDSKSELYRILITHSEQVKDKALDIIQKHPEFLVNTKFIEDAALLHDIGVFMCYAPKISSYGEHHYIEHGYLGADLLRKEGLLQHALVAERHTGTGISLETILERDLPLPHRDLCPVSLEEQIICYADKFFKVTTGAHSYY